MPDQSPNNMSLSGSEIKEILAKMLETSPSQIPVVLLRIQLERLMLQTIDRLMGELETSIKQLESTIYDNK